MPQFSGTPGEGLFEMGVGELLDLIVGVVHPGAHMGSQQGEVGTDCLGLSGEGAFPGCHSRTAGIRTRSGDEIHYRFGLGEVHFAGQEGSLGEFTGLSGDSAVVEQEAQHPGEQPGAAMAGELHHIFDGVASGGGVDIDYYLIHRFGAVHHMTIDGRKAGDILDGAFADGPEHRSGDGFGIGAGHPHQADGTGGHGGRDCGNGGIIHLKSPPESGVRPKFFQKRG